MRRVVRAWDIVSGLATVITAFVYLGGVTLAPLFGYPIVQVLAQAAGFITWMFLTQTGLRMVLGLLSIANRDTHE
jgi:hypothetical protein